MSESPARVVKGNMIGLAMPDIDVLGQGVVDALEELLESKSSQR